MKIYINNKLSAIEKVVQEELFYQGAYLTNRIRVLTQEDATDWTLALHFLLPNNRTIGPVFSSGVELGEEHTVIEDGVLYYKHDFMLNGLVLKTPGTLQMTLTINYPDDTGTIQSRKVVGNFINNVIKTSMDSGSNVLVVGANKDEIVQNMLNNLEVLNNKITSLIPKNEKGAPAGVATLDNNSKLNLEQLPNIEHSDNAANVTQKIAGVDLQDIFLMDDTYSFENDGNPTVRRAYADSDGEPFPVVYAKINDLVSGDIIVEKAKNAQCDENGRNIATTYAVEDEVNETFNKIFNGDKTVGKAEQDGEGNNIADTYAKDNYVNSTFTAISNGNFVVGKSQHDKDGNDIGATYAKKSETTDKFGKPNGIATLNENGVIPSSQLPSYVDDVIEGFIRGISFFTKEGIIITVPEAGKIYLDIETNKSYRWSGSSYVEIASSIALGETSATAYAGDKGKKNAEDIAEIKETLPTLQPKLTAGNGISISADGTISISLPNGDEVAY